MTQTDMAQFEMSLRPDCVKLLDLLGRVNNANEDLSFNGISDSERLRDAHFLANKLISHVLTVLYLLDGTKVQDLASFKSSKLSFVDSASIGVLTRATLEAFLIFHYVFYAPTTAEGKNYRYWAYKAAGLAEVQNFPTITEEGSQALDNDKIELDALYTKLNSNAIFQSLSAKQKRQIFEGKGKWKWKPDGKGVVSWHNIAIDAGLSETLASHMYRHLSGYAHSSSLSVFQMAKAFLNKEPGRPSSSSIAAMNIVTANMIREYCALFPRAQEVLSKDLKGHKLVKQYIQIDSTLDKYMGIVQNND